MEIRSILLPTDFSDCGNYALSYAASLARTFGASIICVHVIEPMVPTVGYSGMTEPLPIADISDQLEDSAERELPKLAECEECAGLDMEELIVHGEAAAEIVRVAKDRKVDLIVVSSMDVLLGCILLVLQRKRWSACSLPGPGSETVTEATAAVN